MNKRRARPPARRGNLGLFVTEIEASAGLGEAALKVGPDLGRVLLGDLVAQEFADRVAQASLELFDAPPLLGIDRLQQGGEVTIPGGVDAVSEAGAVRLSQERRVFSLTQLRRGIARRD
jgi:hypothetical protein